MCFVWGGGRTPREPTASSEPLVFGARKVRWLLRALRRERETVFEDVLKKQAIKRGEGSGGGLEEDKAEEDIGGEDDGRDVEQEFFAKDRERIRRQLEDLRKEDKAAVAWVRPEAERNVCLPLPYLSSTTGSSVEGALQILAFLHSLLRTFYASFEADEQREPSDPTPLPTAAAQAVTVSRSLRPLPVPSHLVFHLERASALAEGSSLSVSALHPARSGGAASPVSRASPPRPLSSPGRSPGKSGATPTGALKSHPAGPSSSVAGEKDTGGGASGTSGTSEHASARKKYSVGRTQQQQRQLLLLQQNQQRSRNRLRQEKPRRLKFLHECDSVTSNIPFAFWRAFGQLMRVPHTHVPSCTPFTSYEHMDALEQLWGDATALAQLRSSGLSYKILHANAQAAAVALAGTSSHSSTVSGGSGVDVGRKGGSQSRNKGRNVSSLTSPGTSAVSNSSSSLSTTVGGGEEEEGRREAGAGKKTKAGLGLADGEESTKRKGAPGGGGRGGGGGGVSLASGKPSAAMTAARGAIQGVIAAATGVAGAAANGPSFQWVLWQLQSAMENVEPLLSDTPSGDTTPSAGTRDGQETALGAKPIDEQRQHQQMLLLSAWTQQRVLEALEERLGLLPTPGEKGGSVELPLLVVMMTVVEALIVTRPYWQAPAYASPPPSQASFSRPAPRAAASLLSGSGKASAFSSCTRLTPLALSTFLCTFVCEAVRCFSAVASCVSQLCLHSMASPDNTTESPADAIVKVEGSSSGLPSGDLAVANTRRTSAWYALCKTARQSNKDEATPLSKCAETLCKWLVQGDPRSQEGIVESEMSSPSFLFDVALCLLSGAAASGPHIADCLASAQVSGVHSSDAEGKENAEKASADLPSGGGEGSQGRMTLFTGEALQFKQTQELLEVAGTCVYSACACWDAQISGQKGPDEEKESGGPAGETSIKEDKKNQKDMRDGRNTAEKVFNFRMKKLLAWTALLQRQVAAALAAGGKIEGPRGSLCPLSTDNGEGAVAALAALTLLDELSNHEEEAVPAGDNRSRDVGTTEDVEEQGDQKSPGSSQAGGGDEATETEWGPSLSLLRRKAVAAVVAEGIDIETLTSLHSSSASLVASLIASEQSSGTIETKKGDGGGGVGVSAPDPVKEKPCPITSGIEKDDGSPAEAAVSKKAGSSFAVATIVEALVETLKEEELHLASLALRVHEQAQRYAAEEPTAATLSGGPSAVSSSADTEDASNSSAQNSELLSSDLQADLVYFFHSTVPFLSRVSRETSAVAAASVSFSESTSQEPSLATHEETEPNVAISCPPFPHTPTSLPRHHLAALPAALGVKDARENESMLVALSPVLESFFLRLTSLYGDIFSLLALRTSRTLDAPLVSCLGMAVNPNYPMEPARRQRYGVDDKFLLAVSCSLPVFLSSLKAFRRHAQGAALNESAPMCTDFSVASVASPAPGAPSFSSSSPTAPAQGLLTPTGGSHAGAGDEKSLACPHSQELSSGDETRGVQSPQGSPGPGHRSSTAQQVLPTLDTPFCVWGVAVPSNSTTAQWLLRGRELQLQDDDEDQYSVFSSTSPSSVGTPTAGRVSGSLTAPSPNAASPANCLHSLSSQTPKSDVAGAEAGGGVEVEPPMVALSPGSVVESVEGQERLSSSSAAPAADGCYLHSTAARLCVAVAAFVLTELVAVAAFCSCCTAAVEKKKFQFLPAAAGMAAVTAGGGAGGAGAAASAALALATIAAKRGSAWRDLCFSGQLARWCLHSLLLLTGAPLEATATGAGSWRTGSSEELQWQLHPLTCILPVLEDEESCVMDISSFRDTTTASSLDEGNAATPAAGAESGTTRGSRVPPLPGKTRGAPDTPVGSSSKLSPGSRGGAERAEDSSLFLDTLSPVSAVLSGALGDAVVGRNEERGALDGGEYATRLGQLVWSALEVEMLVRELGDGAGSSQLEGLVGLVAGERSGGMGTAGKPALPSESKSKKGERAERAARAASAAPAPVAFVPEWLKSACREEDELPWEKKLSGINVFATTRPAVGSKPGVADWSSSSGPASCVVTGRRQVPGLELYLPAGLCSSSLPLAALQICLRVMRISCVRGFEQELLLCAAAACSAGCQGGEKGFSSTDYTLHHGSGAALKTLKGGKEGMFSKACRSAVSSYVPEPETATAAVTEALQTFDEARKEQVEGGSPVNASEALPKAVSALAPFATVSGSNVFLVIPLAARLLQVQRAATAVTEPLPGSVVPKHSATLRKNEDGGARGRDPQRRSTRNQQEKTWCWAASEVPDRLGDIAHCIACCYFLVYGQPVLRPTPPLDKLVLKTTKEQMRSNFVEGSLPAAVLGVYIHRAVQRCAPWATELPCRGKSLSISTFLFPSRETREFGRSVIAASDALLFNSPSPPDVSVPPYLPPFLHMPSAKCLSPLPYPYPPGLCFSLFWAHVADPLVLPRYLHLFLLLSVQQLQLSQPLQIPLQMQQLLQQQVDGGGLVSQESGLLLSSLRLPSLRSVCNLGSSPSIQVSDCRTSPPGFVSSMQSEGGGLGASPLEPTTSQEMSPECGVGEPGRGEGSRSAFSPLYIYPHSQLEEPKARLRHLAKAEGWERFIHQADQTSLDVAPLDVYTPYAQHIYGLHRLQALLLLHLVPASKHQYLLDAYCTPVDGSSHASGKTEAASASLSFPSLLCPSQSGAVGEASAGESVSGVGAQEAMVGLQKLLRERLLYRGNSDTAPAPARLSFETVVGVSRVLAASALSAVGKRPLHGSPPSLRGFSLHLLQLLQQAQRTASTEVEALERVGFAARTAALAPANPSLWTALGCLLLEVVLLLLDKHTSAGGGGLLTGFGASTVQNGLFKYMKDMDERNSDAGAGALVPPGVLPTTDNSSATGFPGSCGGSGTREYTRNGGGGAKGSSNAAGKKGDATSSVMVTAVLWRLVGCPGDKAAPCEEILLQLFAHACLVSNLCGEIWLAAMKRFSTANPGLKDTKNIRSDPGVWEKLQVLTLSSSWWSKMKHSSKKVDDPSELQWRFVVARLDVLLLLVLLWKHFRFTNSQANDIDSRPYAAVAADLHRQRWTAAGSAGSGLVASLFAKAPLGGRGDGLSELQKLLAGKEANVPDSKNIRPADEEAQQMLAVLEAGGQSTTTPPEGQDGYEGCAGYKVAMPTSEDVHAVRSFVLEASRLLQFVYDANALPLAAASAMQAVSSEEDKENRVPSSSAESVSLQSPGVEDLRDKVWKWTATTPLSRCKMWVDAETFLWPLALMRSKWLARLAQWTVQIPEHCKDAGLRGQLASALESLKSLCSRLTRAAEKHKESQAEEPTTAAGGRPDVVTNGGAKEEQAENESSKGEENHKEDTRKEENNVCIASVFYSSALCDASDALMLSCIQAFGAEAMLDSSTVESEKASVGGENKRPRTEPRESPEQQQTGEPKDRVEATTAPASMDLSAPEKCFVSARVSLRQYYQALADMEELVEADGDVLPLAMPLYHLHALRLKMLVASKGALWKLAALFPWKKSGEGAMRDRQQGDSVDATSQTKGFDQRLDWLVGQYLRGEKGSDIKREIMRLRTREQMMGDPEDGEYGDNEFKEELSILRPFRSPADVVADCVEVLQYLALKSRQAGLWTTIPRLLLVDAALVSGHASLALRHLRHLFARGCPKLLPPDAWLSNHYQALKQRRPAHDRSKMRLYLATSAAVVLSARVTLKRTEKKKEEQLSRFRAEDREKASKTGKDGPTVLPAEANSCPVAAGEGWIFGGLEKIESLDEVVQGVKLLVEQLDAQLKLLRRVQLLQLQNELQLALMDDQSPPRPGTAALHGMQSQVLQLQSAQGSVAGGGGAGPGASTAVLDEDAQQTNSAMQAEVVRALLDGAVTVFETLVASCPDVLDMREMHRAITQLFPDVGVPEVEPQNTYEASTATVDGRLLRLLRDAVVAVRGAAPHEPMQLLRKLRSLRIGSAHLAGDSGGAGCPGGAMEVQVEEPEVRSVEHTLEQLQTRLETVFVMACRKLLYHNPAACSNTNEENKDQTSTPPGVAVMKLSLGLPVRCGMEVQEIEKAKEALAAFGKATRAGAPSMELFLKSGKVTGGGGGDSAKKGRPGGSGRSAGAQRGGGKGESGQEPSGGGAALQPSDGSTAFGGAETQRGGAKRVTSGEVDGGAAPLDNKRRKTEESKVAEIRASSVQGAEATSGGISIGELECVIEVE